MIEAEILNLDHKIFKILNGFAGGNPMLDTIFIVLSEFVIYLMIGGLIAFLFLNRREKKSWTAVFQAFLAAFIGRVVVISIIRIFIFRFRPFVYGTAMQLVAHSGFDPSFPSFHTTVMFAFAISILFTHRKLGILYLVLAGVSALARVITGLHFPIDIFFGALGGTFSAFLAKWLFDFYMKQRRKT